MEVNNGNESDNMEKIFKKVIQSDEFIVKESRWYNVSVLINHHQDFKNWWCFIKTETLQRRLSFTIILLFGLLYILIRYICCKKSQLCDKQILHQITLESNVVSGPKNLKLFLEFLESDPFEFMILFTNPSVRAGYDTRTIFKRSLTGLNSVFSFS